MTQSTVPPLNFGSREGASASLYASSDPRDRFRSSIPIRMVASVPVFAKTLGTRLSSMMGDHDWSFGHKTIGVVGSWCLMINNALGAGIVTIPEIYSQSGIIVPTVSMVIIGCFGVLCSAMMCEAMRHVPGNEHYRGRVEYVRLTQFFVGETWGGVTCFFLVAALMTINIASIIISVQTVDQSLLYLCGRACGINLDANNFGGWVCSEKLVGDSPFTTPVVSQGFIVCLLLAIPLGILNLEDNMGIQIASTFLCFACIGYWIWHLAPEANVPTYVSTHLWGSSYRHVMGAVLSNFAFTLTVPSWCNEKIPTVSVNYTLYGSIGLCILTYVVFGIVTATAFEHQLGLSKNFMALLQSGPNTSWLIILTCQIFPILVGLLGVPVMSIICRYNLLQSELIESKFIANMIAVVLPWAVTIPCQSVGGLLQQILDWGSLCFGSVCNFIIPAIIYTAYQRRTSDTRTHSLTLGLLHNEVLDAVNVTEHWALPGPELRQSYWKYQFGYGLSMLMGVVVFFAIVLSESG